MKTTLTWFAFAVITLVASAASADPLTRATVGGVDPLPEPALLVLLGLGLAGVGAAVRKRRTT